MTPVPDRPSCELSPEAIALESPMPHSPILDREEPELSFEPDIPVEEPAPADEPPQEEPGAPPPETAIGRRSMEDAAAAGLLSSMDAHDTRFAMTVLAGIPRFQRLFREVAGIDVDKEDLRRHEEFVNRKIYDLLLRAVAIAKANGRDVILPCDVPITKGLQERMHEFRALNQDTDIRPILDEMAKRPPLELEYSDQLEAALPDIAGALSVALARSFSLIDPDLKNPQAVHWERAFNLFDLLL
jgi:hypothetical protein